MRVPATAGRRIAVALCLVSVVVIVLLGLSVRPSAQDGKNHQEFARLAGKAATDGDVGVIVHLAVSGIDRLTAASARFQETAARRAVRRTERDPDSALAGAIQYAASLVATELEGTDFHVNAQYVSIPFVAMRVTPEALARLENSPNVLGIEEDVAVRLIDPDGPPAKGKVDAEIGVATEQTPAGDKPLLDTSARLVGATTSWNAGINGSGWYVAVLDVGIRSSHQFFAGKSIVEACFSKGSDALSGTGDCPNGLSSMTGPGSAAPHPSTYLSYDHGTHVAGIATGSSGFLAGVAKQAGIIAIQVFSRLSSYDCGGAPCLTSWNSDSLAALDYLYSIRGSYRIASVNMSLGGGAYSSPCDSDSRRAAIDNLRLASIATVIATGNDGYCRAISAPACVSSAIAVGATNDSDVETDFSNWHPSMQKVYAPGYSVYSSTASSDSSYGNKSGTSMATPHVAGAFALLKQAAPNSSVTDLLRALTSTGVPVGSTCDSYRTPLPRIKVDSAIASLAQYQMTIQSTQYGTTFPSPGVYRYPPGMQLEIVAVPDRYSMFMNWSGHATGTSSPAALTIDADKTATANFRFIYPPVVTARKVLNRTFSQAEYIDILSWQPNAANQGLPIAKYRVYATTGGTVSLLAELPANSTGYQRRNTGKAGVQYSIAAVTSGDREGAPAVVTAQ